MTDNNDDDKSVTSQETHSTGGTNKSEKYNQSQKSNMSGKSNQSQKSNRSEKNNDNYGQSSSKNSETPGILPPYHASVGVLLPLLPPLTIPSSCEERLTYKTVKRLGFTFQGASEGEWERERERKREINSFFN